MGEIFTKGKYRWCKKVMFKVHNPKFRNSILMYEYYQTTLESEILLPIPIVDRFFPNECGRYFSLEDSLDPFRYDVYISLGRW